jgi:hypothetical protein
MKAPKLINIYHLGSRIIWGRVSCYGNIYDCRAVEWFPGALGVLCAIERELAAKLVGGIVEVAGKVYSWDIEEVEP